MVSNVTNTAYNSNLEFAKKATKYLQNEKVSKESTGKEIVSSLPTSAAFASVYAIVPAAKSLIKYKNVASNFKENLTIAAGQVKDEALLNTIKKIAEEKAEKKGVGLIGKMLNKSIDKKIASAGEKAIANATKNIAKKSLLAEAKGIAIFNLLFEIPNIYSAFANGGIKEGIKQIGRSGVNVAGDALGYAGGMKLGAAIGSLTGNPIGTILGGAIGMVLGGVASTLIGKVTEKIMGKNYTEQLKEQQENTIAQEIAENPVLLNQLKAQTEEKIALEKASGGKVSKDTLEMEEALQNVSLTSAASSPTSFSGIETNKKINDSIRLSANQSSNNQTTTNPINTTNQTTPTNTVWSPKTVGEITSGLFDSNGQIKTHSLDRIA